MKNTLTEKESKELEAKVNAMTIREYLGEEQCQVMRNRLEQFFNDTEGFVFISTNSDKKISDAYKGVCPTCTLGFVKEAIASAKKAGLLWRECDAK